MEIIIYFAIFIIGLIFGSFINALNYRIENGGDIFKERSICPKCKKQLKWYDLIPIISWIVLKGKCRYCQREISYQYPTIEFVTGMTFVGFAWSSGFAAVINKAFFSGNYVPVTEIVLAKIALVLLFSLAFVFVLLALHDAKTFYIISKYVYIGIAINIVYLLISYQSTSQAFSISNIFMYFLPFLLTGLIPALIFAALHFGSKGKWMGAGDIELAFLLGFFQGWPKSVVGFYIAFIAGTIYGLGRIYLLKDAKMKSQIPFGPFLIFGSILGYTFGLQIVNFYVKMVLGV